MSDVHQGDSTPAPSPAEAPTDVTTRNIPDAIEGGTEADRVRESVKELNRKRREEGTAVEEPEPVKIRYEKPGTKSLRQVAKDMSQYHRLQKDDAQYLIKQGMSPKDTLDLSKNEEFLRARGLKHEEAVLFARDGEMPPKKIGAVKVDGFGQKALREPLADNESMFDRPADE